MDNLCLILVGLVCLALGLYRTMPLKFDKTFWWQNGPLLIFLAIGSVFLALRFKSGSAVGWGVGTITFAGRFLPLMVLLCTIMALGSVIVGMYKPEITGFLLRNPNIAPLLGSAVAPSPNTFVGIIQELWVKKEFQPNFLFFLNAASISSLPLLMLRTAGFKNMEICYKMYFFGCVTALMSFPFRYLISRLVDWLYNL